MELVAYFYRRLYQTDTVDEAIFSNKETAFAAALLENHSFEDLQAWVDFALAEARRTGFDIRSFGGIRQYAAAFEARRAHERQHHERETAQANERRERQLQNRYQQFYRSELFTDDTGGGEQRKAFLPRAGSARDCGQAGHPTRPRR